MFNKLSIKSAKQSASNLSLFLKEAGYIVPKSVILEAIAKVFFFKNWNTMEGVLSSPINDNFKKTKKKFLYIKINRDKKYLLSLFQELKDKAKCKFEIQDVKENNFSYVIEFDFLKNGSNNYLTLLLMLKEKIKNERCKIEYCYFWDVSIEKEDLTALFNN